MQRLFFVIGTAFLLLTGTASAQRIYIDYDREADVGEIRTYRWADSTEDLRDTNELAHRKVVAAIDRHLQAAGQRRVDSDPDVYVTYHTAEKTNIRLNSTSFGYGYPSSLRWGGYWRGGLGSHTTTVTSYTKGTLIIDIWNAETSSLLWRGMATAVVPTNPGKAERRLEKALGKMVKKWEKMKRTGAG